MSGLEVLGGISAIIAIIDGSIKIYDSMRKDIMLPETFETVRTRLPIVANILQTCKNDIEPVKDSMPAIVCEALEIHIDACEKKAAKLRDIFGKTVMKESDTWSTRQIQLLRRLGKGSKVDELMISLTQDVQLIVNNHMLRSIRWQQISAPGTTFGKSQEEIVGSRKHFGLCLGQAPYIPSDLFIGRGQELDAIDRIFKLDGQYRKQQRLVISGIGGIGKTQLAIAYSERRANLYKSIFWLNAASEAMLKESFRSIAGLILNEKIPGLLEEEGILTHVHRWLSDRENSRWLLTFDNYDEPGQFEIEKYYPPTSHGAIIVTTRRPDLVSGEMIRIQPIQNIDDSLAILQTRSQRENVQSDPYAKQLAARLSGLPLALATAGAYLQRSTFTFQRYLEEYEKHWNIDPQNPTRLQDYQKRTFFTTWDLSYVHMERDDFDAAKLLKLLAYFDNQNLWYDFFCNGLKESSQKWLHHVIGSDITFDGVMRRLTDYCFLEVNNTSQSWSMHKCVHDWTLGSLNKDVDVEFYRYAFDCVAGSITGVEEDFLGYPCYSRSAAHAKRLIHPRFEESKCASLHNLEQLSKGSQISRLLREQIQLEAAEQMYLWMLARHEKALGVNHISTLQVVDGLGLLYHNQSQLGRAEQMYTRALNGFEKTVGPDHKLTLQTINNIGLLCSAQGKLNEAEQLYLRALTGFENTLGSDHKLTLRTMNNIGLLYNAQGNLDKAEQMHLRALYGFGKVFGADHIFTLCTVNNTGMLYSTQGKLVQAEQMYLRALHGFEKTYGTNHTVTLRAVNNIGMLYSFQGKLDQAEEMYVRALTGFEKAFGTGHIFTLRVINNIALLYSSQGKLEQAKLKCFRALVGFEKALGSNHWSTLHSMHSLGIIYHEQGQLDQAAEMYHRALVGFEKTIGVDHTSTLHTINSLGCLYHEQDNPVQAEEMYLRALVGFEKVHGLKHTSCLQIFDSLGILYQDQKKLDEAEQMYLQALTGCEETLGTGHASTLRTVNNLGNLYHDQDKLDEAEQMYLHALKGREETLGADHVSTLRTVNNLGNLYHDQDKLDEAEQMYLRALKGREENLGVDHESTLRTVNNLGSLYQSQFRLDLSEQMYLRALTGREKILGAKHASTLRTAKNLRILYDKQGKLDQSKRSRLGAR